MIKNQLSIENASSHNQDSYDFNRFIESIHEISEDQFNYAAFKNDVLAKKIGDELAKEYIENAKNVGVKWGKHYKAKNKDLFSLFEQENIHYSFGDFAITEYETIFAEFKSPNNIVINSNVMDMYDELVNQTNYSEHLSKAIIIKVIFAHEFFHYIEEDNIETIATRNTEITLWRFLGYNHRSTMLFMSEIAAMYFAKEYLDLQFAPYLISLLLMYVVDEEKAYQIYENINQIKL